MFKDERLCLEVDCLEDPALRLPDPRLARFSAATAMPDQATNIMSIATVVSFKYLILSTPLDI